LIIVILQYIDVKLGFTTLDAIPLAFLYHDLTPPLRTAHLLMTS